MAEQFDPNKKVVYTGRAESAEEIARKMAEVETAAGFKDYHITIHINETTTFTAHTFVGMYVADDGPTKGNPTVMASSGRARNRFELIQLLARNIRESAKIMAELLGIKLDQDAIDRLMKRARRGYPEAN